MQHLHKPLTALLIASVLMAPSLLAGRYSTRAALNPTMQQQSGREWANPIALPWMKKGYETTVKQNGYTQPTLPSWQNCKLPYVWDSQTRRCGLQNGCPADSILDSLTQTCRRCPAGSVADQNRRVCVVMDYKTVFYPVVPNGAYRVAVTPCSNEQGTSNSAYFSVPLVYRYEILSGAATMRIAGICEADPSDPLKRTWQSIYFSSPLDTIIVRMPNLPVQPMVKITPINIPTASSASSAAAISSVSSVSSATSSVMHIPSSSSAAPVSSAASSVVCPMYSPPVGNCQLICAPQVYNPNQPRACPQCFWRCTSSSSAHSSSIASSRQSSAVSVATGNVGPAERDTARQRTSYWRDRQPLSYTPDQRYVAYTQLQNGVSRILYWLDTVALNRIELQGPSIGQYGSFSQPIISGDGRFVGVREHEWFVQYGNPRGKLWRYDVEGERDS